ncbi:MAG: hypothetical protein ACI31D_09525 [Candidatus Limisoma sp.]
MCELAMLWRANLRPQPTLSEARGVGGVVVPHAKRSPRLSVGFTTTGASPTHTIHSVSSTRCGFSFAPLAMLGRVEARRYSVECQWNALW